MFDKRNIRIYYLKTLERIRSFLLSRNSREFLIFLFFVFVSFCFWLLQVLNDDYETEFSIPLRLKNVPSDVVLTSELPDELRIGVKDRGTVLANYMLGQTFYPIVVDFKDYEDKGSRVRIPVSALMKKDFGPVESDNQIADHTAGYCGVYLYKREGKEGAREIARQGGFGPSVLYLGYHLLAGFSDGLCSSGDFGYHHGCLYTGIEF